MRFSVFGIGKKKRGCEGDCCNGALWVKLTFRRTETGELYEEEGCALKFLIEQGQGMADKEVKQQRQIHEDFSILIAPRIEAGFQAVAAAMEKGIAKVLGEQVKQIG